MYWDISLCWWGERNGKTRPAAIANYCAHPRHNPHYLLFLFLHFGFHNFLSCSPSLGYLPPTQGPASSAGLRGQWSRSTGNPLRDWVHWRHPNLFCSMSPKTELKCNFLQGIYYFTQFIENEWSSWVGQIWISWFSTSLCWRYGPRTDDELWGEKLAIFDLYKTHYLRVVIGFTKYVDAIYLLGQCTCARPLNPLH